MVVLSDYETENLTLTLRDHFGSPNPTVTASS